MHYTSLYNITWHDMTWHRDVDSYNASELCRLSEEASYTFTARDEGIEQYLRQLTQGLKAPKELELRVGAQVSHRIASHQTL